MFFSNPYVMIGMAGLSALGSMQAGRAENRRQQAIADQQEQNAKFEKLRAMQEHNARLSNLRGFQSAANVARAVNQRGQSDRSYRAIMKASQKDAKTDEGRARTQTLFTQSRMKFAAADARFSGSQALRQGQMQALGTMSQGISRYMSVIGD